MESTREGSVRVRVAHAVRRRPELAALLLIPALLLAQWALALALHVVAGPAGWALYVGAAVLVWAVLSSVGSGRAAATAIVGPMAVGVGAAIVMAWAGLALAPVPMIGTVAWLVLCMGAWDRVWPAWKHWILRRPRPGPFDAAYDRVLRQFDSMASGSDARALWTDVQALEAWRTYRTAPLIDLLGAWFDLGARNGDAERAERMRARLEEETAVYRASDPAAPDVDAHPARPTRGTPLEFLLPELEALLAVATPGQRRRMVFEAARCACRSEGVLDDALAEALDAAADGRIDPAVRARLDPDVIAPPADADPATYRRAIARWAAWRSMAGELDPNDAADAIYEAARQRDDAGLAEMTQVLGAVLDDEARASVRPVQPDPEVLARVKAARLAQEPGAEAWSPARLVPANVSLAGLIVVGAVAGVLGTVLREPLWPLIEGLPGRTSLDVILGVILVALSAWVLLRITGRATSGAVVIGLFLASYVAAVLIDPLVAAGDALLSRIAPGFWSAVYADPPTVLPYAPYHGLAFALTLVALALLLRIDDRPRSREGVSGAPA